jgi:uroporphyrinogen decarboxylase
MTQSPQPRLVRACRREILDRPPVWLMRQAGRYLPEYMAVREKVPFLELCKTPELAIEVSMQPLRRFGMDGVIMFSDILVPVEAMGLPLEFTEKGPYLPQPVRSATDVKRLGIPDPLEGTGFVMSVLDGLKRELTVYPDVALIGFAGAPWTLASYMVEGGVSRNYTEIKKMMLDEPLLLHDLLDRIARTVILYLNAQIEAGAQVIQLFDTWAGILPETLYRQFVLPYHQQVIEGLNRDQTPIILYVNGSRGILPLLAQSGADVISVDWLTPLSEAREVLGEEAVLQGNLDSNALFTRPEVLKPLVENMVLEGGQKGYIFNLGHGILPKTPVDNVQLLVDTVKSSASLFSKSQNGSFALQEI